MYTDVQSETLKNLVRRRKLDHTFLNGISQDVIIDVVYSFLEQDELENFFYSYEIFKLRANDRTFCCRRGEGSREVEMYGLLDYAVYTGHLKLIQFLLQAAKKEGCLDEAVNSFGYDDGARCAPLHLAARTGRLDIVKLLVEQGADLLLTEQQFDEEFYGLLGHEEQEDEMADEPKHDLVIFRSGQFPHYSSSYDDYTFTSLDVQTLNEVNRYALDDYPIDEAIEQGHVDVFLFLLNQMKFTSLDDETLFLKTRFSLSQNNHQITQILKQKLSGLKTEEVSGVFLTEVGLFNNADRLDDLPSKIRPIIYSKL